MVTIETAPEAPSLVLSSLAAQCLDLCGGDYDKAEERIRYLLKKERDKYFPLLVAWAASEAIRHERTRIRGQILRSAAPPPGADRGLKSLTQQYTEIYNRWLAYPLRDGSPLGAATAEKLKAEAAFHLAQSRTMAITGRWFEAIVRRMDESQTVADALSGEEIESLRKSAELIGTFGPSACA